MKCHLKCLRALLLGPCLLFPGLSLIPKSLHAQTGTATIRGTITDSQGAVIVDAEVVITNTATGNTLRTRSNKSGIFISPPLQPASYSIRLSKQGFSDTEISDVTVNVADQKVLNIQLKVGSEAQTISVDGSEIVVNTVDASVGTVINRKFVENIPLNGRSFQDLISMTPGVVTQSPQTTPQSPGYSGDFSVNGQRTESNYYTVDGVAGNTSSGQATGYAQSATGGTIGSGTALGTTQSLIPVDALQEFRVQSSTYSAEFGRSPGGQFSMATRSGTNQLHGGVFEYFRNDVFDANDWFNNYYGTKKPALRQNDFGGTVGGPVVIPHLYSGKGGTFFFGSYEGLRLTQPQAATVMYVPDTYMRQQASADIQPILNAYPLQTGIDYGSSSNPGFAQFIKSYSLPSQIDSWGVRIDHTFNPKLITFFRYSETPSSVASRSLSVLSNTDARNLTYTAGITSQLGKSFANEFRLGYARSKSSLAVSLDNFGGATPINLSQTMGLGGDPASYPYFYIYLSGYGAASLYTEAAQNRGTQWNLVENFFASFGKHQVKAGFDYRRIVSPLLPASPYAYASFTTAPSVIANKAGSLYVYKYASATPVFNDFAAFVQDEWRTSNSLHLSFGLRWELAPPPTEANGNNAYTVLGSISNLSALTLVPQGTPLWKTPHYNFAPRLGLAWTAHNTPNRETVVRTGAGVFFDTDNQLATQGFTGLGFVGYRTYSGVSAIVTPSQLNFSITPTAPYTGSTVFAFPSNLQLPYTIGWNAALEQKLGKTQALTLTYVGSNGRRQVYTQQILATSYNKNFGAVRFFPGGATSNYHALQAQFQRTIEHGVQALVSYTWAHSIDKASTGLTLPIKRGNSDFDVRNNFQAGLSWDIPSGASTGMLHRIVSDWALDGRFVARSGFPVNLQGNYLLASDGSYYYSGVDLVPGKPIYLYGSQYPGGRAINPAAFNKTGVTSGNAPRNFVRAFGENQINTAVRRQFHLGETATLQFRAEAFNVLNHPNFGYVNPTLGQATFGQATKMLNQSLGSVASQYQQGGPRSMQFALKVAF